MLGSLILSSGPLIKPGTRFLWNAHLGLGFYLHAAAFWPGVLYTYGNIWSGKRCVLRTLYNSQAKQRLALVGNIDIELTKHVILHCCVGSSIYRRRKQSLQRRFIENRIQSKSQMKDMQKLYMIIN